MTKPLRAPGADPSTCEEERLDAVPTDVEPAKLGSFAATSDRRAVGEASHANAAIPLAPRFNVPSSLNFRVPFPTEMNSSGL